MPNDDGQLLFTEEEKLNFLEIEPRAVEFIRPLISAREYLHGEKRFCLWLLDAKPEEIRSMPEVKKRIEAVRAYRKQSNREATKRLAKYPSLFGEIRQPKNNYVLIPLHSSENRNYIPFAFFGKEVVANNSCSTIQSASLYHFGVLQSSMHMTWINQLCGRLEGRYRYSNDIVYNNYPWPISPTEKQRKSVEIAARQIIECREMYPDATLADLYDPLSMPKPLLDAHKDLNSKVDRCYRDKVFKTELERLEYLFNSYQKFNSPLIDIKKRK